MAIDWRDSAAYEPLLDADRSLIAWEWLRRDPDYRMAAQDGGDDRAGSGGPEHFGLVDFESPELGVPDARPLWHATADRKVLSVGCGPVDAPADDRFDLGRLGELARLVRIAGSEHLLLSDGFRVIRIDAPRGTFANGPVCLRYELDGLAAAEAPVLTLQRLLALCRTGRFSRTLHPRAPRARRWVLQLRAWDASCAGAGQREIAELLLSPSVAEAGWRSRESSVRSQVQRLVRAARQLADGGFRKLLH